MSGRSQTGAVRRAGWETGGPPPPGTLWWLGAALLAAAVVLVAVPRRRELAQAYHRIAEVHLLPVAVAVGCEALSFVCFAGVYRWLLAAGGVRWSLRRTTAVVVAANSVSGALPGGAAFSAAWFYRQLRRRAVEPVLAAAVLVMAGALSALSLSAVFVAGAVAAGPAGLRTVLLPLGGLLAVLAIALTVFGVSRFARFRTAVRRAWARAGLRSRRIRRGQRALARLIEQARSLQPGLRPWLRPFTYALLNWTPDITCLAAALWALDVGVPWHGLLLVYVLTQIPGSLRLTPGSLGVVETSLSALLVLYGLPSASAIAATLLYRAISFWAPQPVGWASWLAVTLQAHPPHPPTPRPARPARR
ncbi:TIGR00374 family protein [Streptomyces sp. Act143]|uniref:lysylphosphatidylglycerol synthase transmembrane domain-containing protein n=1 Tax=Streptomyces sp. Act143 TaxID=2200760 RepID=UPI000D67B69C|nr:YbhN family protein [Streptomyces sp. Act143]PWI14963.1 TIGR00374 family protein [Streptomyces sp. Act143]